MVHIGEVLMTNTKEFTAQSLKVNESPSFGSFVKVRSGEIIIFGIVHQITTESIDSNRRPMAFGKPEEVLLAEQPQLLQLLKTDFSCVVIGHQRISDLGNDNFRAYLPANPPKIHAFVEACEDEEIKIITEDLRYLQFLVEFSGGNNDQLLIASIIKGSAINEGSNNFLVKTGKYLLPLLKHDLDRFNSIFRSVR